MALDSAGVVIALNEQTGSTIPERWIVAADASIDIGGGENEPPQQFSRIVGLWEATDGRLMVADAVESEIRAYDASGRLLQAFGRRGEGPGEFRSLATALPYRGDSIAVWDSQGPRLLLFDAEGSLGRTSLIEFPERYTSYEGMGAFSHTIPAQLHGALADGTFLVTAPVWVRYGPGERWGWDTTYLRLSENGQLLGAIATFPGPRLRAPDEGSSVRLNPFSRRVVGAVGRDHLYVAPNDAPEIRVLTVRGEVLRTIRMAGMRMAVDANAREAYRAEQRTGPISNVVPEDELERALREIEFPEAHPPFAQVLLGADEELWVREYRNSEASGTERWRVFDQQGRLLGLVHVPERLTVHQVTREYVLGVWFDEMDVPFVRGYRLEPAPADMESTDEETLP